MSCRQRLSVVKANAASFCDPGATCQFGVPRPIGQYTRIHACRTPILSSEGRALGSFAVFSREPRSPTPQPQKIIEQITHLAAVAIERKRTETAGRESEERFRRMADNIPEVIWFTAQEPGKGLYLRPSF